ncbi:MAG: winged helix-turn-helix transcriptional regulator [Pelagimonas sp.]|uniref:winged helix-turn-helix transcriptional regulator n=1 Tax=Pelagimonas sp. TaxID=2073170 RepID=UPI003D6B5F9A
MRYLIAETSWDMMSLAQEILATGTLLTRTDRPEDLTHYLSVNLSDLLLIEADQLNLNGVTLRGLRRDAGQVPIVLLAPDATSEQRADWLSEGADAIIDPSCAPAEINSYLMAIARRALGCPTPVLEFGPLTLGLNSRKAHINGCPVKLSPKIYEMLEYIALRPGQLVSREALMTHLYGLGDEPEGRVFDVYACNIRACLKATQGAVELETVRGIGFRLTMAHDPASVAA